MATTADNKTAVVWGLGSETSNQLTAFDGDTGRQLFASAAVPGVSAPAAAPFNLLYSCVQSVAHQLHDFQSAFSQRAYAPCRKQHSVSQAVVVTLLRCIGPDAFFRPVQIQRFHTAISARNRVYFAGTNLTAFAVGAAQQPTPRPHPKPHSRPHPKPTRQVQPA